MGRNSESRTLWEPGADGPLTPAAAREIVRRVAQLARIIGPGMPAFPPGLWALVSCRGDGQRSIVCEIELGGRVRRWELDGRKCGIGPRGRRRPDRMRWSVSLPITCWIAPQRLDAPLLERLAREAKSFRTFALSHPRNATVLRSLQLYALVAALRVDRAAIPLIAAWARGERRDLRQSVRQACLARESR